MSQSRRRRLAVAIKLAGWLLIISLFYVLADFAIDFRPRHIQEAYRFRLPTLQFDTPVILQNEQLRILVIKRSEPLQQQLISATDLQDPDSRHSRQPDGARNRLRSATPGFFVSVALGTDLGCPLTIAGDQLIESCGDARYDFAGRAKHSSRRFDNLVIPDYQLSGDGVYLTVYP